VLEYLIDEPEDTAGRELLLRHAYEVGGVAPVWGDGCGMAVMP
jgi:hypothetical protein